MRDCCLWLSIVLSVAACDRSPVERDPPFRVVHVAWPGRPVSDAMDRQVFGDPRVQAVLARVEFERYAAGDVPDDVRAVLNGMGTVVFWRRTAVGRHRGALSTGAFVEFVRRSERLARALFADGTAHGTDAALRRARAWLETGLPERAEENLAFLSGRVPPAVEVPLRVEVLLELGDVAKARQAFDAAPAAARCPIAEGRILVAERRSREAVAVLRGAPATTDGESRAYWLGRALLDCEERQEAYALLEPLALGHGPWGVAAREALSAAITGAGGHSHR